ncbi:MAG: hypothetical protein AB1512_25375 [Thermodesulfobacteriota bacterium]
MKIGELRTAMALIQKNLSHEAPLSQIQVFLLIAENEGIHEEEIAKQMGIPTPTIKRNIAKLTQETVGQVWVASAGHAVCEVKDDGSVFLSEKGKQLLKSLSALS